MIPTYLYFFVYALLGLIVGSFLNVVILRRGARGVGGRSGCLSCGAALSWYDLIPVVSWFALKGRCRACGTRISIQYPIVEATTALLFGLVGMMPMPLPLSLLALAICAMLVLISAYDILHTIIPDEWVYTFIVLCVVSSLSFMFSHSDNGNLWSFVVAGPVAAAPLFLLWAVSRGHWMGFGDVKLSLGIGWLVGLDRGFIAVFLAFVIGAFVSVCILIPFQYLSERYWHPGGITRLVNRSSTLTMKSEVPFGPFLIASCLLVWMLGIYGIAIPFLNFS